MKINLVRGMDNIDMTQQVDRLMARGVLLLLLAILLMTTGCRSSLDQTDDGPSSSSVLLPRVSLSLVLSESLPGLRSTEVPDNHYEAEVRELQFLLFDAANGDKFVEIPEVIWTAPKNSNYHTSFHIHHGEGRYKLLVVANYTFTDLSLLEGKTLREVQSHLITSEPSPDSPFVMVGLSEPFDARNRPDADLGQIRLIRLASRVDVSLLTDQLPNTKIVSIEVRNRVTQSHLMPVEADPPVRESKVYSSLSRYDYYSKSHVSSVTSSEGQIYLYENPHSATEGAHRELGTVVVVRLSEDGEQLDPIEIPLPAVQRNRIFKIQLRRGYISDSEGIRFEITIRSWVDNEPLELPEKDLLLQLHPLWRNPLSYMAEHNISTDKQWLPNDVTPSLESAITASRSRELFASPLTVGSSLQSYHLPTMEEWNSIFPIGCPVIDLTKHSGYKGFGPTMASGGIIGDPSFDPNQSYQKKTRVTVGGKTFEETSIFMGGPNPFVDDCGAMIGIRYSGGSLEEKIFSTVWLYYGEKVKPETKGKTMGDIKDHDAVYVLRIYAINTAFIDAKKYQMPYGAMNPMFWREYADHKAMVKRTIPIGWALDQEPGDPLRFVVYQSSSTFQYTLSEDYKNSTNHENYIFQPSGEYPYQLSTAAGLFKQADSKAPNYGDLFPYDCSFFIRQSISVSKSALTPVDGVVRLFSPTPVRPAPSH